MRKQRLIVWCQAACVVGLVASAGVAHAAGPGDALADPATEASAFFEAESVTGPQEIEYRPCGILKTEAQLRGVHAPNLWPNNQVPYAFDANVSVANQAAAISAMALIEGVSAVDFVPRTTQSDYVVFRSASGNNSFVGRIGGAQTINIFNWNVPFIIVHECMHALGIFHEQSRPDRGAYVQINSANICQNCCSGGPCDVNFQIEAGAFTVGAYDFESVMHYDQCAFSTCSNCPATPSTCRTITVLPPYTGAWQTAIGQRSHFSAGDVLTIQTMYPSLSTPCTSVIGDLDDDTDVDLDDMAVFQGCYDDGTGGRPECSCADANVDEFVDLSDVPAFIAAIRGPARPLGACCDEVNGTCSEGTASECVGATLSYQGDGVACADTVCTVANPGACCDISDFSCTQTSRLLCEAAGNLYKGDGTNCSGAACPLEYTNTASDSFFNLLTPGAGVQAADDMTLAGSARKLMYYDLSVYGQGGSPFNATVGLYTACPGSGGTLIPGTSATFNNITPGNRVVLAQTFPSIPLPNTVWMQVVFNDGSSAWIIGEQAEVGSTTNVFGINQPPWFCNAAFTGGSPYAGFRANILCAQ